MNDSALIRWAEVQEMHGVTCFGKADLNPRPYDNAPPRSHFKR